MNKFAVFHITDTPYAYGKDLNTLTVRIRTAKNDITCCKIRYKDRYDWQNPFNEKEMKVVAQTDLFDFFETEISVEKNRYRYFFELIDQDDNKFIFDDRGFREEMVERPEATAFQFAYLAEADVYRESKWMQEAIVYQIFPDRFSNGDKSNDPANTEDWGGQVSSKSMFGGDLQGIIDKLDYLEELGIDLIYLTPVFKSTSNHKYNTTDYFDIDPSFGNLETARELVKKSHAKGIKIIFDAVFNHSGSDFFAFQDLLKNQENSRYKNWYFVESFPVSKEKINYYTFSNNVKDMPKLRTQNHEVKDYLLRVGEYWVKEIGIDGWRLDVCDEVDHEFWREFKKTVKAADENAVIIGEIMHEASSFLKGDQLDSIMNYPFKGAMVDYFAKKSINAEKFDNILAVNRVIYMDSITRQMWNLFGSHDTKRFLTECGNDIKKMKLAVAFQFSYIGVPYIYYGDEVGLEGGDDPQCRKCMIWDENKQNQELLKFYKTMISIRRENKALIHGDFTQLYSKDGIIAFERGLDNKKILVVINNNDEKCNLDKFKGVKGVNLISGEKENFEQGLEVGQMDFKIIKLI